MDPVTKLYAAVFYHVWDQPQCPTPPELAEWIETRTWPGIDRIWLADMIRRLKAWPRGENYPLIPDDEALQEAHDNPAVRERWYTPGSIRGDLVRYTRRTLARSRANT